MWEPSMDRRSFNGPDIPAGFDNLKGKEIHVYRGQVAYKPNYWLQSQGPVSTSQFVGRFLFLSEW